MLSEMFRLWRQRLGDEATYLLLAEAFEILKWRNMIIQLLDLFCLKSETMRQLGRDHPPPVPRLGMLMANLKARAMGNPPTG